MGILDDAIREHLELKRKHGASGEDLDRLEKEAFGPPARPGDPEFESDREASPEVDAGRDQDADRGAIAEVEDDRPFDAGSEFDDWSEEPPSEEVEAPFGESGGGGAPEAFEGRETGTAEPESEEVTAAEQARRQYADLGDTVDHPAVSGPETGEDPAAEELGPETGEDPAAEDPGSVTDEAREAEPPETAIFDQDEAEDEEDFGDLDLELDIGDQRPAAESRPAPPVEEPGRGPAAEREDDDFDFDIDLSDLEEEPEQETRTEERTSGEAFAAEPETAERGYREPETGENDYEDDEPRGFEADRAEEDELEDEDEDLLEETPDFLEDTPEGERLWFEQGEPKDFDFDD